jgi:hypothetical protein
MRFLLLLSLSIIINLSLYSQCNLCCGRINCIIFIDGQIPLNSISGNVEYCDSTNEKYVIAFKYNVGEIIFSEKDINTLQSLPINTLIQINLEYTKFKRGKPKEDYNYSTEDFSISMILDNDYIIFNIINLNKRNKTFDFGYSTSTLSRLSHRKEAKILQSF